MALTALVVSACGSPAHPSAPPSTITAPTAAPAAGDDAPAPTTSAPAAPVTPGSAAAGTLSTPSATAGGWVLGATPLPLNADGTAKVLPTPAVLRDRRLQADDVLPPPADGRYHSSSRPIDDPIATRLGTTWQPGCPVALAELRYLEVGFWGFDGRAHTGELVVAASVADGVQKVFGTLFAAHFPIEDMHLPTTAELAAAPTGDGNGTAGMVCRPARGTTTWSAHAYGLAIDVNPFQNPYQKGARVLPELASAYLDRSWSRPGMIRPGDVATRAFASIGWTWGGSWASTKDRMHFSQNGR